MGLCCPTNRCLAALLVLCLLSVSTCTAANTRPKVLVLLDSLSMQETHSKFLQNLNAKEFDVTVAAIDTGSIQLRQWDEWLFDRLVIIGGSKSSMYIFFSFFYPVPVLFTHSSKYHHHY